MKAVVLAAGRGKRLNELTEDKPKVMCPVHGKPMLECTFERLQKAGIEEVVVIVHYKKEQIIDYFGDNFNGMKLIYAEQKEMLGTGDAVLTAKPHMKDDRFLVLAGDVMFEQVLLDKVMSHDNPVITVCEVEDPSRYGVIETTNGHVKQIVEKSKNPPSNLANASVYLFPHSIFNVCENIKKSPRGEYEITDAIQYLIDNGTTFDYEIVTKWIDVGVKEQLHEAHNLDLE